MSVCWLFGRSVCHNFLKGREVTIPTLLSYEEEVTAHLTSKGTDHYQKHILKTPNNLVCNKHFKTRKSRIHPTHPFSFESVPVCGAANGGLKRAYLCIH